MPRRDSFNRKLADLREGVGFESGEPLRAVLFVAPAVLMLFVNGFGGLLKCRDSLRLLASCERIHPLSQLAPIVAG